jgi:cation diffusion facilitator CzcD-associated flavoprotein CzcO
VGLIGTGSSGIQATPRIAAEARHLTVFQRTPNFTIPARHTAFPADKQAEIKRDYAAIFARTRESPAGFPYFPIERNFADVSPREREAIFDQLWDEGGFKFLWGSFRDLITDSAANEAASEYIRRKIRETVKDPETAGKLCPRGYPYGSKRPPIDTDYYATFNRDNVSLADIRAHPIEEITASGLRTSERSYELDALVFATGFDAMTGSLLRIDLRGAGGLRLADAWKEGPRTLLGLGIAGFPNLFTITGPGSPSVLVNMPVAIEHHVDWIADCLRFMRTRGAQRVEATEAAQERWARHVAKVAELTVFGRANSWYVGANIPGKPRVVAPYAGGQPMYRERCRAVQDNHYEGFAFDR